jgi:hypothetical protein
LPSFKCWTSSYNSLDFVILAEVYSFRTVFISVMLGLHYNSTGLSYNRTGSSEMELNFFKTGNFNSLDLELEHELDFCYVAPALEMMKSSAFIFTVYGGYP